MGLKEKEKGARGEKMLRDELRRFGFGEVTRGFTWQGTSDLVGLPGIHVECKFCEKLTVRQALLQAIEEAKKRLDGLPTVFWKMSRRPWVVIMLLDDWMEIYRDAMKYREEHKEEMEEQNGRETDVYQQNYRG